jgi:hypothetical protein
MDKMRRIQSAVLPTLSNRRGRQGFFFNAPLGYKLNGQGTVILSVGKWFRASRLVITDTNLVPSREVLSNGMPQSVTGSITLEPYELITYQQFANYFRI